MIKSDEQFDRRSFIKKSSLMTLASSGLFTLSSTNVASAASGQENDLIIGPKDGFTPQIGTLVSMLEYMRLVTLDSISNMSVDDLDYFVDPEANTIGGLISHIISTEKWCQIRTFDWKRSDIMNDRDKQAEDLGDDTRRSVKGNNFEFYQNEFEKVRKSTLNELANRNDDWLMEIDKNHHWGQPVNKYCEWFHVIEHECQHLGQISFIKKRFPVTKKVD
ncbi:MAG: hypothetical protein ACI9GZ_003625 [Bacteroidia bacterium]|jgi:hypothetical protein